MHETGIFYAESGKKMKNFSDPGIRLNSKFEKIFWHPGWDPIIHQNEEEIREVESYRDFV